MSTLPSSLSRISMTSNNMQSPPSSAMMIRKDSTMSQTTVDAVLPSSNGHETSTMSSPSTKTSGSRKPVTPYIPKVGRAISSPFSTNKSFTFSTNRTLLHPNVAPFRPGRDPISFLNTDSIPDGPPNTVKTPPTTANIGRAMRPIGSGSPTGSAKSTSSLHEGPTFTTDSDGNLTGTRYVVIGNIPEHWVPTGLLNDAVIKCGIASQLISNCVVRTDAGMVEAYLFFNDIRDAQNCRDAFGVALTTATFKYIDHHQYFAEDPQHPRAERISAFDGQIDFSATYIGDLRDFSMDTIFKNVKNYAASFGEIRTFALQEPCEVKAPRFRVEYFTITDADNACKPGDLKEFIEFDDDTLIVNIKGYTPEEYQPYAHPAVVRNFGRGHASANGNNLANQVTEGHGLPVRDVPPQGRRGGFARGAKSRDFVIYDDQNVSHDMAPEYRRHSQRPHRPMCDIPRSGLHDQINYEALRASGPEDIHSQPQMVVLRSIIKGVDVRTTVMVRNIPNKLDAIDLKEWLDETSGGLYDFSYLRVDFSNNCNVGYAFVNFSKPEYIVDFVEKRVSKPWNLFGSEKTCEISYATIQGQDCLIAKFRNSSVMREWEGFRPKVFYSVDSTNIPAGQKPGDQAPFPEPNNLSKLQRSLDNAQAVGLYPPRAHQRGRDHHPNQRRSTQYDRGTPRALLEERALSGQVGTFNGQAIMLNGQNLIDYHPSMGSGPVVVYLADPRNTQNGQQYDEYASQPYPAQRGHGAYGPSNARRNQQRRRGNHNNY